MALFTCRAIGPGRNDGSRSNGGDGWFAQAGPLLEIKARLLCCGAKADAGARELFRLQNPAGVKRGGLSSGGKMLLDGVLSVNFPVYEKRETQLAVVSDLARERGVLVQEDGKTLCVGEVLEAPAWYGKRPGSLNLPRIFTAHNRQLAASVFEDCSLFATGEQCQFCVMNRSLSEKDSALRVKSGRLLLEALSMIPADAYDALSLNSGMTLEPGRGAELIVQAIEPIRRAYPSLPIAVEVAPPSDLAWIDKLAESGASSIMMNLEMWDQAARAKFLPGKDKHCPRKQYLAAFERALKAFGPGKVSTCFVVGTEPPKSLRTGITRVVSLGVVPSPLAGRYFEDVPGYPFVPNADWRQFLEILKFAASEMRRFGLRTADRAGCVACGMCDLIKDMTPGLKPSPRYVD